MLAMPSLRSCSVGPPPSAIHGRGRLTRHPCRVAHCAEPPLGLSRGRPPPQPPRRPESRPGSLVVCTLPHCDGCTNFGYLHIPPVGAGLLAMASVQPIHASTDPPLSPASRLLQGIGFTRFKMVGAGLPAMGVNDNAGCLNERVVQTLFAGKPAPTGNRVRFCFSPLIRPSVSSPSAFDLSAPSRGRAQVLRSGQPGMDAGLAAPGHGWPMAAGPRSRTGARAWRALASHRTKGARALGYLGLFQVTRRKGETNSRHNPRNGYTHQHSRQKKREPKGLPFFKLPPTHHLAW